MNTSAIFFCQGRILDVYFHPFLNVSFRLDYRCRHESCLQIDLKTERSRKMLLQFIEIQIKSGVEYTGVVEEIHLSDDGHRIRIFVSVDEFEGENFVKSLKFSKNRSSQAGRFFSDLGLMDSKGCVDLDELIGEEVLVTLSQGADGNWYVDKIWLTESEEDDTKDFVEDDEDFETEDEEDEEDVRINGKTYVKRFQGLSRARRNGGR